jgi:predicted nucleic acid-binding protein
LIRLPKPRPVGGLKPDDPGRQSIWIDHLRSSSLQLAALLNKSQVFVHPFVIGEIALGHLKRRQQVLNALSGLPQAEIATDPEVLSFIEFADLTGKGVGYLDVHLLASAKLSGALLWTRDKRLASAAEKLELSDEV